MTDIVNLLKKERNVFVRKIKMMFEDAHHWVGNQAPIVQIAIAFCAAFLAVAILMKAFA